MVTYEPFTKVASDKQGEPMVCCRYDGTEMCRLHKASGCNTCPVFAAILKQLHAFEEIYLEDDDNGK